LGGSEGRDRATALGVVVCLEQALKKRDMKIEAIRIVIQGFGNAGSLLSKFLYDRGARIIGISDANSALHNIEGLVIVNHLVLRRDSFGIVTNLVDDVLSNSELFEFDCDVIIPAAIENQITKANAPNIKTSILCEATNGPTTTEASRILTERGVLIVPDVLA